MENQQRKTILVAGIGLSPAVLTNTVWALAHELPAVLPDEVVAVTTRTGRECIEKQLLSFLGYSSRTRNYESAIRHLIEMNLIEMTIPDKPRSKKQKYRLTEKGRALLAKLNHGKVSADLDRFLSG
ncbi:Fic family protein [Pontiella sp.]|uniref:Fic family protein n=1 Tax=Pontiella sp. TaxID=2837462 RepID=UPI00356827D5